MIQLKQGHLTNASRLERGLMLTSLLVTRPDEFFDRLAKRIGDRLEYRHALLATYEPVSLGIALSDLSAHWKESTSILEEPAAREIEHEVSGRFAAVSGRTSWDVSCNADLTLARCLYLACRVVKPAVVVETGVAYGVSSAFILKALDVNREGKLFSIDLPFLVKHAEDMVGILVPEQLRHRWELHRGVSRRKLPRILKGRQIDIFVHDSLHSYTNMRYEFETVWPSLRPGGVLVADDIQGNAAFDELRGRDPSFWRVVRQEGKPGCFGMSIK